MTVRIWNIIIHRFTSIRFDTVRLGKMACAKLLNILGEKPLEDTLTLNYQVMLRESTQ